jgi:hypothetical protein
VRNVLNARKRHKEDGVSRGYHPQRGGRYDIEEDRSPSPKPLGPRVFSQDICNAPFLARFRQPANVTKYSGETNPELWLDDYRLAYQLGGVDNDRFIIRMCIKVERYFIRPAKCEACVQHDKRDEE